MQREFTKAVDAKMTAEQFAKHYSEVSGLKESSVGSALSEHRRRVRNLTAKWENEETGEIVNGLELAGRLGLSESAVKNMDGDDGPKDWKIVEDGKDLPQLEGGGRGRKAKTVNVDEIGDVLGNLID